MPRIAWISAEEMAAALHSLKKKRGTAERLRATEECLLLSTRSQMVPRNTTHPPPSPFAGTAVSNVWVCHGNDWLNFAEIPFAVWALTEAVS